MRTFPLANEPKPKPDLRRAGRRYVRREVSRRCRKSLDEINVWLDSETYDKKYHQFFLKLYFEWKYVLKKEKFVFKEMVERKDEYEFLELLNIIQKELGLHYSEFPYKLKTVIDQLKEKTIDGKQQHNSREDCYFWSNEQSRLDDRFTKP